MAKRKKKAPDPPPGVPAWMATFSDLVTLLLTFFVMLMAMASFEDSSELDTVMESLRQALAERGFGEGLVSNVFGDNLSDAQRKSSTAKPIEARPREAFDKDLSPTVVKIDRTPTEVRLTLDETVFFASGRHTLAPGSRERLQRIGRTVADLPVGVRVEGHTDTQGAELYNLKLSQSRAQAVVDYLIKAGVNKESLDPAGFGESRPLDKGETEEAHSKNRRVEFLIIQTE